MGRLCHGEAGVHIRGCNPAFYIAGLTTSLEFGEQLLLGNKAIVIVHIEDGIATMPVLCEKYGRAFLHVR